MRTTRGRRGARGRRGVAPVVHARVSLNSPPPDGWSLGYIKKLKPLPGRGDSVFLAEVNSSGERFVLKKLDKKTGLYPASASAQLEQDLHMSFKHPNVIRTLASFETESSIYLMMEYAECGDLFEAVFRPGHNEYRASQYLRDVILGLQYIHSLNVVHRDVKAENIVLTSNGRCKLIDFGFATRIPKGELFLKDKLIAGTIDYLSPEIICKQKYNQGIDIWAIGVLAYVLVCRHVPFAPHSSQLESTFAKRSVVTRAILEIDIFHGVNYAAASPVAKDFFERVLVKKPRDRMTLEEMLAHPFLNRSETSDPAAALSSSGASTDSGRVAAAAAASSPTDETSAAAVAAASDGHTVADLSSVHGREVVRRRSSSSSSGGSGRTCSTCSGHSHSSGSCSSSSGGGSSSGIDSDGSASRRSSAAGLSARGRPEEGESDEADYQASAGTRSARSASNASQHSYTSQHSHHSLASQHSHHSRAAHHSRGSSRGGNLPAVFASGGIDGGGSPCGGGGGGKTSPSAVGVGVGSPMSRAPPCHLSRSDDLPVGLPSLPIAPDIRNSPPNADDGSPPYKHTINDLMVSHLDHQFTSMDLGAETTPSTSSHTSTTATTAAAAAAAVHHHHHRPQQQRRSSRAHAAHSRHHSSDEDGGNSSGGGCGTKPRARHKYMHKKGGGDTSKRF